MCGTWNHLPKEGWNKFMLSQSGLLSFERWVAPLWDPERTFREEKGHGGFVRGITMLVMAGFISKLLIMLQTLLVMNSPALLNSPDVIRMAEETVNGASYFNVVLARALNPLNLVFGAVSAVFVWLLLSFVFHVTSVAIGGTGDFKSQSHILSLVIAPLYVLQGSLGLVIVPLFYAGFSLAQIRALGMLPNLATRLLGLYLLTHALAEAHGFGPRNAVKAWLMPLAILFILWAYFRLF